MFEAIDKNIIYSIISKTLHGEDKHIWLQDWDIYHLKDNDTFKLITNKYHGEYYFNTVNLACLTIYGDAEIDNSIFPLTRRNSFFLRNLTINNYVKPVFFSTDPENDFDTFKSRSSIETKFTNLRLKYYIILPFMNSLVPTYLYIQFHEYWDRNTLPRKYHSLIQNLYNNESDIKVKLITPHIFQIFLYDEIKLSCQIVSNAIDVNVFRPISLVELLKLYDYVYIISYILISPNIFSNKIEVIWKFIQGVYNNTSDYLPYSEMLSDILPPFTNSFKHNIRLKDIEKARVRLAFFGDLAIIGKSKAFDVILKSIQ